jgi:hypothetical protein
MKRYIAIALLAVSTAALAANLVSQVKLADGRLLCVYSDGSTIITSFNNCPSFK